MDGDNNWDKFKYPKDCRLSDRAKATLVEAVKSGKGDPFRICKPGRLLECSILVQRECFNQVLNIKESHESKA